MPEWNFSRIETIVPCSLENYWLFPISIPPVRLSYLYKYPDYHMENMHNQNRLQELTSDSMNNQVRKCNKNGMVLCIYALLQMI